MLSEELKRNITKWFQRLSERSLDEWNQIELVLNGNELLVYYSGYFDGSSSDATRIKTVSANSCPLMVSHHFDKPAPTNSTILATRRNDVVVDLSRPVPEIDFGSVDVSDLNFQQRNSRALSQVNDI